MKTGLLTRDEFRTQVLERDSNTCVLCDKSAVDVHHIIDRKCFTDGGYYINNGVSLCSNHHIDAEKGILGCDTLRNVSGIKIIVLPNEFDETLEYNKWGEVLSDDNKFKYPRTKHFSWSEGVTSDDKIVTDLSHFEGQEVICSVKMDGENTSILRNSCYARSLDSNNHPSRNWVKGLWGTIKHDIPEKWRICGENLYATHSIHYDNLPSYFMVFNIWNEENVCLSWDETLDYCFLLNLTPVKVIYRGIFDINIINKLHLQLDKEKDEGFVMRLADSFKYTDFSKSVVKWVRSNHVNTDSHWSTQKIIPNKLK